MNTVLYNILNQIRCISILLSPIIPNTSDKVLNILKVKKEERQLKNIKDRNFLKPGEYIKETTILFKKSKMIIDSHCHLNYQPLITNIKKVISRAQKLELSIF